MLSKPAIGLAIVAVGASVYVKYYGFPDLQQEPANVQAQLERAASMKTSEPMVLILGTLGGYKKDHRLCSMIRASTCVYGPSDCCCAIGAAGYLLFIITAGAFAFETGHAAICAVKRYRWKPAGAPQAS
jgi:hypothetical protein